MRMLNKDYMIIVCETLLIIYEIKLCIQSCSFAYLVSGHYFCTTGHFQSWGEEVLLNLLACFS